MPQDGIVAECIQVNGIVQGVGFRPFIFQLARTHRLTGEVSNISKGVRIHVEGPGSRIQSFKKDILSQAPPLSRIIEICAEKASVRGFVNFIIVQSTAGETRFTLISPDVSVCEACVREMRDPENRRYRYPFINCTHCGPRYTIIEDIPYDRPKTSMRRFSLCEDCLKEYQDPFDRRFHAQPNACAACGPKVTLLDHLGGRIATEDPIKKAAELLSQGRILAIKGLGGVHLAVNALDETAVMRLRERKQREEKPLAIMAPDLDTVRTFAEMTPEETSLLSSPSRPIVLLTRRDGAFIAASVSPANRYLGVMLPYTPLHYLLFGHGFTALVMTSGNISDEPMCIENSDALVRLEGIADYFLLHDRDIYLRTDDTVLRHAAGRTRVIRRSRGYVPVPVFLNRKIGNVLAVGAELKNTVCLTRGDQAFLSQHIGDLENQETFEFFTHTISHLKRILDIEPDAIAHDLHPDYLATRYASSLPGIPSIAVQHHHAHIRSCMAEHRIDGPVVGLAFDGTGYGLDGNLWGGEVLLTQATGFTRAAHLAYTPMPGGAAAIRHPWRMGVSYAYHTLGEGFRESGLGFAEKRGAKDIDILLGMIQNRLNSPLTSSLGRLFDGVAALAGIREEAAFEGQAAMMLEMAASGDIHQKPYDFSWTDDHPRRILIHPIISGVLRDVKLKVSPKTISARFHATLTRLFTELCKELRRETGLDRVVLSGGCFQNILLLREFIETLTGEGFTVFAHEQVPTNDGGISLGQAVIAGAELEK